MAKEREPRNRNCPAQPSAEAREFLPDPFRELAATPANARAVTSAAYLHGLFQDASDKGGDSLFASHARLRNHRLGSFYTYGTIRHYLRCLARDGYLERVGP